MYGYQDGTGLIMDVMTPSERRNGAAVLWILDEGVKSCLGFEGSVRGTLSEDLISRFRLSADLLLDAGYAVFAVAHRSSPRYRMDEVLPDLSRAVRFVRCHAARFGIEPHRIGITGSTSGGGLALLAGASPPAPDSQSEDPVDREPSQVNAIVAHCPFSDLLNYGRPDSTPNDFWGRTIPAFDFHSWNETSSRFERIVEPGQQKALFQHCSPLNYISSSMPPTLLMHGDADPIIPVQQSELLAAGLRNLSVPHKLLVYEGMEHSWSPSDGELEEMRSWFDKHLE